MAQSKKEKLIFSIFGKNRKIRSNLDVTSPPPEASFTTTNRAEALKKQKEFKTKYNDVKILARKQDRPKFLKSDPEHPKDFAGKPVRRKKKKSDVR